MRAEQSCEFDEARRVRRHLLRNGGLATLGAAMLFLSFSTGPAGHSTTPSLRIAEKTPAVSTRIAAQRNAADIKIAKRADAAGDAPPARHDAAAAALLFGGPVLSPSAQGVLISAAIVPSGFEPVVSPSAPVQVAAIEPVEAEAPLSTAVPYPPQRPAGLGAPGRTIALRSPAGGAGRAVRQAVRTPPAEEPGFFQRLVGALTPSDAPNAAPSASPRMMAYAPVDDGATPRAIPPSSPSDLAPRRERTAIYVIEDRTVYMPDGSRLEAHSGLGPKMDNPKYVHVRMHGSTPPNVYNLVMRERLFHGVEAIRMLPTDRGRMFGRDGILAHTYMLGPRGDSNGCVSFRDYAKFLAAFKRGEVTRMVVVANQSSLLAMNARR